MPIESKDSLVRLLLEYNDQGDHSDMQALLEAAQKGLTTGANACVDAKGKSSQPADLKQLLRCYPLAHALLGLTTFIEMNKDTEVARHLVNALIDSLEIQQEKNILH